MGRILFLIAVVSISTIHFGCDNRALGSTEPISLYCEFHAIHMEDTTASTPLTLDTLYVYALGTDANEQLAVYVNDVHLPVVGVSTGQMLFATSQVAITPETVFSIKVQTPYRTQVNTAETSDYQPSILSPPRDTLYTRDDSISVVWDTYPGDTTSIDLEFYMPSFGDSNREWVQTIEAAQGGYVFLPETWTGVSDTTATINVYRNVVQAGEGFSNGMVMTTRLVASRRVRISAYTSQE